MKTGSLVTQKKKRLVFYILMTALPLAQFCIFYVYVNFKETMNKYI